jgi:NADH-quinone oxidoreductase subunit L
MVLPLLILAVPAILSGFLNLNGGFGDLVKGALPPEMRGINPEGTNWGVLVASTLMALLGIGAAAAVYFFEFQRAWDEALGRAFKPVWVFLTNRMYLDALAEDVIVRYAFYGAICVAAQAIDTYVIDGAVNGVGWLTRRAGFYLRNAQNGELQTYGFVFLSGVVLIAALLFVLHP